MRPDFGFLKKIQEHPNDDTPRLIYADYLGGADIDSYRSPAQLEHGEFIQVQCALARLPESPSERRAELEQRQNELLTEENRLAWTPEWMQKFQETHPKTKIGFSRGFPDSISLRARDVPAFRIAWEEAARKENEQAHPAPWNSLKLADSQPISLRETQALGAAIPETITSLDLGTSGIGNRYYALEQVRPLVKLLPRTLESLNVGDGFTDWSFGDAVQQALAAANCTNLKVLSFKNKDGLVRMRGGDMWYVLGGAYRQTWRNGKNSSLFHLETIIDADGNTHPLPEYLKESQLQARKSWEKAHPPEPQVAAETVAPPGERHTR